MKRAIILAVLCMAARFSAIGATVVSGADPTGQQDSTSAIQAALNVPGEVDIPCGHYLISSTLVARNSGTIRGEGPNSTFLITRNPALLCVEIASSGVQIQGICIQYASAATGGACVQVDNGISESEVHNFMFQNYFVGVGALSGVCVKDGQMWSSAANSTGIMLNMPQTASAYIEGVLIDDLSPVKTSYVGIDIQSTGLCNISHCTVVMQGTGLYLDPTNGSQDSQVYVDNSFFDSCGNAVSENSNGGVIWCVNLVSDWLVNASGAGLVISGSQGIVGNKVAMCHIFDNPCGGVVIYSTASSDIHIIGCDISSGPAGYGVFVADGVSHFSIKDNTIGTEEGGTSNCFGIVLGGNNSKFMITGNDLTWNYHAGIGGSQSGDTSFLINDNLE